MRLLVFSSILAAAITPALAAEKSLPQADFETQLIGHPVAASTEKACFIRRYDPAHLTAHPRQKVTEMRLLMTVDQDKETKAYSWGFGIDVRLRKDRTRWSSGGDGCSRLDLNSSQDKPIYLNKLVCALECDGGSTSIKPLQDGKAILLSLDGTLSMEAMNQKSDEDRPSVDLGGTKSDDQSFRLDRAPLTECLPENERNKLLRADRLRH
jgi:hypothetical protein